MLNYTDALRIKRQLEANVDAASHALQSYRAHRLASGLLPDAVRLSEAYRSDKAAYDRAFAHLRDFNGKFMRVHGKQYRLTTNH